MTPTETPDCNHDAPASFAAPSGSGYWPIWKHMADNHGLTLLDSECEDILHVADQMLMRRLDSAVANIHKNIRLVDTKLRVMTETLRQIANSGRNSTRDRRNARATLRFLDSLTTETPNDQALPRLPDSATSATKKGNE